MRLFGTYGPLSAGDANAVDLVIAVFSEDRQYLLKISDVTAVLENLERFVERKIQETGEAAMAELVKDLAVCTVNLIVDVILVVVERDSSSEAAVEMPPVLPHQLVSLQAREFSFIRKVQSFRPETTWLEVEIDIIEQVFEEMQATFLRESIIKNVVDACDHRTHLKDCWKVTQDRFCFLQEFYGGLATASPGTSTVESDFLIVN